MRALLVVLLVGMGMFALAPPALAAPERLRVGSLELEPCPDGTRWWCGSLPRALDPARPRGPRIEIEFRWLPARRHRSGPGRARPLAHGGGGGAKHPPLVAVEGGPGYPSTGSRVEFRGIYGPLLRTRDLLLVDNRGTGGSALINCRALQGYTGATTGRRFTRLVADCARRIERRHPRARRAADLFATAYAVDDLAAVMRRLRLGRVDLFGDSYGTFFVQSFMARHPRRLHSVIIDSPYAATQLDPWYSSAGVTARAAFDAVCARDPGCAAAAPGSATARLAALLALLRERPLTGVTLDADGSRVRARADVRAVVDMVQDAASDPTLLRELDPAVRAALAGDPAPLLRLVAQSQSYLHGAGPASYFSNGLYWAVACRDYPQLFSMRSGPRARRAQLRARLLAPPLGAFDPFTVPEWLRMSAYSQPYTGCLDWPRPVRRTPAVPPGARPLPASVPLLVIGGDLDSLTPLVDAHEFAPRLARSFRIVQLPNTTHVTSQGYTNLLVGARCARRIIRAFVRAPERLARLDTSCAGRIPHVHTAGAFPLRLEDATPATLVAGPDPGELARRAATVAAGALGDAPIRYFYSGVVRGPGLRGGMFTARGDDPVRLRFEDVRFVSDATVSGGGTWRPGNGELRGSLVVRAAGSPPIRVELSWKQRSRLARAQVGGATLELPAP